MRIFFSFSSKDREIVRRLKEALCLRRPDYSCFFDESGLAGGDYWIPRLSEELEKSDVVLLIVGDTIGHWQQTEYFRAFELSRQTALNRPRIIPIIIVERPAPGLPFLSTLQHIYAVNMRDRSLLSAIEHAVNGIKSGEFIESWKRFQPYKGLPALRETDSAFFFGRDSETQEILKHLAKSRGRIITLIGQSGVGKSSLVYAGVLSRLKSQLWPVEDGVWPLGLADSRSYVTLTMQPGRNPLKELATCLVQLYEKNIIAIDEEASNWARRFRDGSVLHDMLRLTRERIAEAQGGYPAKRFILYIDQGEELYTRASLKEARYFSHLLADALEEDAFNAILSVRSDFYADFQNDSKVFTMSDKMDILPLPSDVLVDVIRRPAEILGVRFEDQNIPKRIAQACEDEPGALPLLSDLMHEAWLNMLARNDGVLRWTDQPGIVDIGLPLRRRADNFLHLPFIDEKIVRKLFTRLTQIALLGEPVRRSARKSECTPEEWSVAEKLAGADQRLLTISHSSLYNEPVVEVAHEQLLRSWPKLKEWLEQEREFLVWRTEIEQAAETYCRLSTYEKNQFLLMGLRLTIAKEWFEQRSQDLKLESQMFVQESINRNQKIQDHALKARESLRDGLLILFGQSKPHLNQHVTNLDKRTISLRSLYPSPLMRRIVGLNLSGLVALLAGFLYLNQFREGLIDARVQSMQTQGEMIAAAIASTATVDTDAITLDPEKMLKLSPGESTTAADNNSEALEFSLNPERVGPILRRLVSPTRLRARIYDRDGYLLLDSRSVSGRSNILRLDLPTTTARQTTFDISSFLLRAIDGARGFLRLNKLPLYEEIGMGNGKGYPEIDNALRGQATALVRATESGETIIAVAVPVQRFRSVRGALLLSTIGSEFDKSISEERQAIIKVFLLSAGIMLLLSLFVVNSISKLIFRVLKMTERTWEDPE